MKGKMKYLFSLLQSLFAFKGYRIEMESDGKKESHSALIAAVCNGAQFGGGIPICPAAEVDDGKFDVIVVDCIGGVWKIIKEHSQKAGIDKIITPHTIRHTFAVHLLENGADISEVKQLLGHASSTTAQIYIELIKSKKDSLLGVFFEVISNRE